MRIITPCTTRTISFGTKSFTASPPKSRTPKSIAEKITPIGLFLASRATAIAVKPTCVVKNNKVVGIITDGDIRRFLEKNIEHINTTKAKDIMNSVPKLIPPNTLARTALEIMEENKITQLIVADKKRKVLGVLHMHRLIEEGL